MNIVGNRNLRKLLEHNVNIYPKKIYLLYEDPEGNRVKYTYEQFNLVVNRVANGLLKLGVKNRDKINIHLTNRP